MYAYHQAKLPLKKTVQLELALTPPPKKKINKQTKKPNKPKKNPVRTDWYFYLSKREKKILICNFCSNKNILLVIFV